MSLGSRIRELRVAKGWTQNELARRSGVSQPTISAYENDADKDHKVDVLFRIAGALQVSPDYLRTGKGPMDLQDLHGSMSDLVLEAQGCSEDEIGLALSIFRTIKAQRRKE